MKVDLGVWSLFAQYRLCTTIRLGTSLALPEVHGHGDGELLVVDGENVEDLHVDVHMDRVPGSLGGGLQLLVVLGQAPSSHTLGHSCTDVGCYPAVSHCSPLLTAWRGGGQGG